MLVLKLNRMTLDDEVVIHKDGHIIGVVSLIQPTASQIGFDLPKEYDIDRLAVFKSKYPHVKVEVQRG